jgi:C-terminal processing protease CtpA/Prc
MSPSRFTAQVFASFLAIASVVSQSFAARPADAPTRGGLFESVVGVLRSSYVDEAFRGGPLSELVQRYRPFAQAAANRDEERLVAQALLSNVPSSHLGLLSVHSRERMMLELTGQDQIMFGFELMELDGKHYAHNVYEGGPAARACLLRGDRVVTIDGQLPERCARLDWRTDDAYLPDPPLRALLAKRGDRVRLRVERRPHEALDITVPADTYSALRAARASAHVIERNGVRIGVIHFWFVHANGAYELLANRLKGEFADCDALVFDLRGRGGAAQTVSAMLGLLRGDQAVFRKPVVALTNRLTRSAKEVLAYELKKRKGTLLVGENTAGAVIPASFADVGEGMVLMYPGMRLGEHTRLLEGVGVEPDVCVMEPGPYSAGRDPIFDRGVEEAVKLAQP